MHPKMIRQWKWALLEGASVMFELGAIKKPVIDEDQVQGLYTKIEDRAIGTPVAREIMAR